MPIKNITYQCSKCGAIYEVEGEAVNCENSHISGSRLQVANLAVLKEGDLPYLPNTIYPTYIKITVETAERPAYYRLIHKDTAKVIETKEDDNKSKRIAKLSR